jgi:hypothetical protein
MHYKNELMRVANAIKKIRFSLVRPLTGQMDLNLGRMVITRK